MQVREPSRVELHRLKMEEDAIVHDVILMNAHAKLGDHVAARCILDAMLGVAHGGGGASLSSSAAAAARRLCHHHSLGIPRTAPTVVTYNTLSDACKRAGELGAALEVIELMTAASERTGDVGLRPDVRDADIDRGAEGARQRGRGDAAGRAERRGARSRHGLRAAEPHGRGWHRAQRRDVLRAHRRLRQVPSGRPGA